MAITIGTLAPNPAVPPNWVNVKDYGAVGDHIVDDTTAIQAAINAVKANVNATTGSMGGQVLYFPPGLYKTTATLDMTNMAEVRILGGSGRGGWGRLAGDSNPPCAIQCTGSGTGVNLADSTGCIWDGVSLWAGASGFTGILMKWDSATGTDVFGNKITNCELLSFAVGANCTLLSLAGVIEMACENVTFGDAGSTGVQVQMCKAGAPATWSNANSFRSCSFIRNRAYSVLNPGTQTTFVDCTFESGTGSLPAPVAANLLGLSDDDVVTFHGCGFWDVGAGSGSWISSTVATHAWGFYGCIFESSSAGPVISLSSHTGLVVSACRFDSPGGGTPNIFDPAHTITNASMLGCYVKSPVVDNHASVFV